MGGFIFQVNPLILEIALWNEAEILDVRPEFLVLGQPARIAEICKQLLFKDVAEVDPRSPSIWIPTSQIEADCGGSSFVTCSRFELTKSSTDRDKTEFKKMIAKQFRRRLKFIVKKCVLAFRSYNCGLTEIDGFDDVGMLRWKPTKAGKSICDAGSTLTS